MTLVVIYLGQGFDGKSSPGPSVWALRYVFKWDHSLVPNGGMPPTGATLLFPY